MGHQLILWVTLAILLIVVVLTMIAIFRDPKKDEEDKRACSVNEVNNLGQGLLAQSLPGFYEEEVNSDHFYKFAYQYENLDAALCSINDSISILRVRIEEWEKSKKESLELGMDTDVEDKCIATYSKELKGKQQELNGLRRLKEQRTQIKEGKDISNIVLDNLLRDLKYRPRGPVFLHTNVLLYTEYEWSYSQALNAIQPYKATCDELINVLYNDIEANAEMMQRDYPLLYKTIKSTYAEYIVHKVNALYFAGMIFMMVCDSCVEPHLLGIKSFGSVIDLQKQYHKEMALAIGNRPSMV